MLNSGINYFNIISYFELLRRGKLLQHMSDIKNEQK